MSEQFRSESIAEIQGFRRSLSSMRVRFAPEVQPVKRTALAEIVKNVLFADGNSTGKTVEEVQTLLATECSMPGLGETELYETLLHLEEAGEVTEHRAETEIRYHLAETVESTIGDLRTQSETQMDEIVESLFANAPNGSATYKEPFIQSVCLIFAALAEESAALVLGELSDAADADPNLLDATISTVSAHFPEADNVLLGDGLKDFFQEPDPRYSTLQLALAQNYFVVKMLGLDPDGSALSREIFEDAVFYLDTNVIIGSLAPSQGRKESVEAVVDACRTAGAKFAVCQITMDELRAVQERRREDREELEAYVPAGIDIKGETQSDRTRVVTPPLEYDDSFLSIRDLPASISETFEADRTNDGWFDRARSESWVGELSQQIREKAPTKGEPQGIHDALLLGWTSRQRRKFDEKAFVLTADRSLPGFVPPESTGRIAITHTALLQWAAPVLGRSEDNFAGAFAELTRTRLLPQSQLFGLSEFRVFRELHLSSADLPAEDVVGCIRYLRRAAPELDPRDPRDVQELAKHVSGYFADPGRKYVQEITRLERELTTAESEKVAAVKAERSKLKRVADEVDRLRNEQKVQLEEAAAREKELTGELSNYKSTVEDREARRDAGLRLGVAWLFAVFVAVLVGTVAGLQSGTASVFDKVSGVWPIMSCLGGGAGIVATWILVGPERLALLGIKLPFQR